MGILRSALKQTLKEALKTSKDIAQDLLDRRRGSSGQADAAETGASPLRSVGPDPHAWQTIGQLQSRRWSELVTRVDARWRENERRVRDSAGGEILAGEWLAVGERLMEQWQEVGARLSRCWGQLALKAVRPDGTMTPWIELEADLDGALQAGWRQFRTEWGEARARVADALQPRLSQSAVRALHQRLDETFRRGESILSDAWLPGQGYLQSALAEALQNPNAQPDGFLKAGQEAWQPLLSGMDKAWDQVLAQLEGALEG